MEERAFHESRFRNTWNLVLTCALLLSCLPYSILMEVTVKGPDTGLLGDFEQFICVMKGEDVDPNSVVTWKYKLQNEQIVNVSKEDILSPLGFQKNATGKVSVSTFIRLSSLDVKEVICQNSQNSLGSKVIQIQDLAPVTITDDLCEKAEKSGEPLMVLQTNLMRFIPPYRQNHYLEDQKTVSFNYPTEVSQLQLMCISANTSPKWALKEPEYSKMKYAAWAEHNFKDPKCSSQIFHINEVIGKSGETVTISMQCRSESTKSDVDLVFNIADTAQGRHMDFNKTEECTDKIVEQFYNKELTGVGIGSSALIVMMMVGIAVLKKQLNQSKNQNRELQANQNSGIPPPV